MSESGVSKDDFVVLLARHGPRVRAFVATLVGHDVHTIDEVVQSALLIAWKKLDTFEYTQESPDEELVRWVCTIARFEVLGYLRDRSRQKAVVFDEQLIGELAELQEEEASLLDDRRVALRGCLRKLQPGQQESIRLRYVVGLSMSEIAARENRSVKAATVAMCRLRKLLEKCVRHALGLEGLA